MSPDMAVWLGLVLVVLFMINLFKEISRKPVPVKEIILVSLSYQLLAVPFLFYRILDDSSIYAMEVAETEYYTFLVPGFSLLCLGMNFFKEQKIDLSELGNYDLYNIGKRIIIIGVIGLTLSNFFPNSLRYLATLISQFTFVGAIIIVQSTNKNNRYWLVGVLGILFYEALKYGMFYDLLIWSFLISLSFFFTSRINFKYKLAYLILGLVLVNFTQRVKGFYRDVLWYEYSYNSSNVSVLFDSVIKAFSTDFVDLSSNKGHVRFNQGYILTRIMNYVPDEYPHSMGTTVTEGLYSAFVPRIFDPNKAKVGGTSGLYERFTGYTLHNTTSKDIGIFGEAYANFGVRGAWVLIFCTGILYSLTFKLFLKLAKSNPIWIFWIPVVLFYAMRAEESYTPILNNLVKGLVVVFLMHKLFLKQIYRRYFTPKQIQSSQSKITGLYSILDT